MAYVKKTWENKPSTASPINANNLNHIEQGVYDNDIHVENVDLYLQTVAIEVNDLQSEKMNKYNPTFTGDMTGGTNIAITGDYTNGYGDTLHSKQNVLTFDNVPTSGSDNPVKSNGIYEAIMDVLPVDTESGNPCVITDGYSAPVKSLELTLEPIQNLHGYDKPWAGGAGKNKSPLILANIKTANTDGTWSGNTYTLNDVTFTVNTDSDGNVNGITVNGTASATTQMLLYNVPSYFVVGTQYVLSGCFAGGSAETYKHDILRSDAALATEYGNGITVTANSTFIDTNVRERIVIYSGVTLTNAKFYPMIRLASDTDATFEPYTNICPISGRTQSVVTRTGKNVAPITLDNIKTLNTTGTWVDNVYTINGITITVNTDSNGLVTSIVSSGIPSDTVSFMVAQFAGVNGNVILNGCPLGGATLSKYKVDLLNHSWAVGTDIGSGADITLTSVETYRLRVVIYSTNTTQTLTFKPMLRMSGTDEAYEPYNGTSITRTYGTTVYAGMLDVTSGVLTVTHGMVDLGTIIWTKGTATNGAVFYSPDNINCYNPVATVVANAVCSYFEIRKMSEVNAATVNGLSLGPDSRIRISDRTGGVYVDMDATAFKTAMNGVYLCYELATPTTVQLTPTQIALLYGDNVLSTDADSIECEYSADIALYIAKKIAEGSQGNRSLSKGVTEESTEEVKEEEETEEPKKEETR